MKNQNPLQIAKHAFVATLLFAAISARAQQYSIPWHKIAGGGSASAGGTFHVAGTIGQAEAGVFGSMATTPAPLSQELAAATPSQTPTTYQLVAGFRAIALQTPGAPTLKFSGTSAGGVFSWSASAPGYTLQQSTSLNPGTAWADVDTPVVTNGNTLQIVLPQPSGAIVMFYRLRK